LFRDNDNDEIIENNELEPVMKYKKQKITWSKKRSNNTTNYHNVLPNVSNFSNLKFVEIYIL
jgi:hypothetical protein